MSFHAVSIHAVSLVSNLPDHLQHQLDAGACLRAQGYRGRFAPTPSGPLHLGNLRTALVSWLVARLSGGEWLLRLDDLDTPRLRPGAAESVVEDLRWLGLAWDGPVLLQSQRRGYYHSLLSHLRRQGLVYACRCSRRDLAPVSRYPGTCRHCRHSWGWLDRRLPAWRLRLQPGQDVACGDVVLRRADGFIAYHLATAVDEITCGISEVVRGRDLASVRDAQVAVMAVLEQPAPIYRHVPLLCDASGQKLAKREASEGLDACRDAGMGSDKVIGHLAAQMGLVPEGSVLTALELQQTLAGDRQRLEAYLAD